MKNTLILAKLYFLKAYGIVHMYVTGWSEEDEQSAVDLEEAERLYEKGATFIDVRTPGEWRKGSVKQAVFARGARLKHVEPKPDTSDVLVTFCEAGDRARNSARRLKSEGYDNVFFLWPGGYSAWKQSGLPSIPSS